MLAIEAGGIAALIVGAVAVARSSAFSSLRRLTSVLPGVPDAADPADPADPGRDGEGHAGKEAGHVDEPSDQGVT